MLCHGCRWALALCLLAQWALVHGPAVQAAERPPEAGNGMVGATPELAVPLRYGSWLHRLQQSTHRGQVLRHPNELLAWLEGLGEPRCMTALGTMALDARPGADRQAGPLNPAGVHNWSEFTDPILYLRWRAEANAGPSQAILQRPQAARGAAPQGREAPGMWLRLPAQAEAPAEGPRSRY